MTLSAISASAMSGLQTAQTGLRTVSDNIANVDTKGYVRKVLDLQSNGSSGGVSVQAVRLVADRFLQSASMGAAAGAGRAGVVADIMDQAQALFGDPSTDSSFFSTLDRMFSGFASLTSLPPTNAARAGALAQVSDFFNQARGLSDGFAALDDQADARIRDGVQTVNTLLSQIGDLNQEISRTIISKGDPTGSQNQQSELIDRLSKLMDVKVGPGEAGGVIIRASDGLILAGNGAATLTYDSTGPLGEITVTPPGGQPQSLGERLTSGQIKGLLDLKNKELPALGGQLAELTSKAADALNAVSNAYSAVPAPTQLNGRTTGLDLPTAVSGFTGKTTVAIVDAAGVIQKRVAIDFTALTMSVDGGAAGAFTPATFLANLNAGLGAFGSASFTSGALSISGAGGNGVAVADDPTTPSAKAGRGFSAFFGLNDLVRSPIQTNYDTGLKSTDLSGLTGSITLRLTSAKGGWLRDVTVAAPVGGTVGDFVNALNGSSIGVYGSFSLDANGQMSFASNPGSGVSMAVETDTTTRAPNGVSASVLFGVGAEARNKRTASFALRSDIAGDASRLPLAKLDLLAAVGTSSLAAGDTRGADALSQVMQAQVKFSAAGEAGATTQTLSDYAAGLSGVMARKAAAAEQARTSAEAVAGEADTRRSTVEGVNLDQELIQLTTYQQAYSASARLMQAAKDMYDILLQMSQ